jgi:hypothetical protein
MHFGKPFPSGKFAGTKRVGATYEIKHIRALIKGLENQVCADVPGLSAQQ